MVGLAQFGVDHLSGGFLAEDLHLSVDVFALAFVRPLVGLVLHAVLELASLLDGLAVFVVVEVLCVGFARFKQLFEDFLHGLDGLVILDGVLISNFEIEKQISNNCFLTRKL